MSTLKTVLELLNVYDPDSPVERTCVEEYKSAVGNLISACQSIAYWWQEYVDSEQASDRSYAYGTPVVHIRGERGRPRFDITKDQLEYLSSLSFSWSEIASILGVSRMTVFRRGQEFNITLQRRDTLTDSELIQLISDWKTEVLNVGVTIVTG